MVQCEKCCGYGKVVSPLDIAMDNLMSVVYKSIAIVAASRIESDIIKAEQVLGRAAAEVRKLIANMEEV